ncbi:hypothetical protein BDR26DRAFT_916583 [Obelidium mucronatum]|nr:hypothetical protein BDR26DRAFT_916583 [Obelidium mucronatum]
MTTAFTVYYANANCSSPAIKITYNDTIGCIPTAAVSECLPSSEFTNWSVKTGCEANINYTTIGNTYLGSRMQIRFKEANSSSECVYYPKGHFQSLIDTCIPRPPNITAQALKIRVPESDYFSVANIIGFYESVYFGVSKLSCDALDQFIEASNYLRTSDECGSYEIINNYGWYKDIFSTSGDCVDKADTVGALKIGRSLNGVCNNSTNPCHKCIPSLSPNYEKQTGAYLGHPRAVLVDGSDCRAPRTKQTLLSLPLDKCIPFVNGTYARATVVVPNSPSEVVVVPNSPSEVLYVDLTTYESSLCSQLAPPTVKRYQVLSKRTARNCYEKNGTTSFPVANLYNYDPNYKPPSSHYLIVAIGWVAGVLCLGNIILRLVRCYYDRPPSFEESLEDVQVNPAAEAGLELPAYVK